MPGNGALPPRFKDKLVDLEVDRWLVDRPLSILVIINGVRVWLPKSQCEVNDDDGTITMLESLALREGLI